MIYSNDDPMALLAMELERTGNYGDEEEYESGYCPVCSTYNPEYFYLNSEDECIGCTECVCKTDTLF